MFRPLLKIAGIIEMMKCSHLNPFVVIYVLCNVIITMILCNECYSLVQRIHNLSLPHWATQDVLDTLKAVVSSEVTYNQPTSEKRRPGSLQVRIHN